MDVMEKLVELQMQAPIGWTKGEFADHLIAHGVTVQDNTEISDELLQQLKNAPLTVLHEEPTIEVVQGWISVKDRLPENICPVLVALEGLSTAFNGWYHDGKWWTVGAGTRTFTQKVTHWMPLPQPPKGE